MFGISPATLIVLLNGLTDLIGHAVDTYAKSKAVLSETDAKAIKVALTKSQAASEDMRAHVDAVLDEAASR